MILNDGKVMIIGVTGNIGSGKTTVSNILKKHGAYVINADKIAKNVLLIGGAGYNETVELFGRGILQENGEIDRAKLANIVFSDKAKLEALNGTTHKYVLNQIDEEIACICKEKSHKIICLDVPLLFESGLDKICDITWVVDAPEEVKLKRVMERDGLDYDAAKARLKSQTPPYILKEKCDTVIVNAKSYDELEKEIASLVPPICGPHY
ncbi:MAG: dephospho-CoA kinase [Defluviitaleaceae bacterium]|nr:dephospho-CoA kinase [Defluviitaleaceae bacterium]